jgi:NADH-quinone oxidoreductase subunit M
MVWAAFAAVGIVLGAAYLLWLYQRVFWGPNDNPKNQALLDMSGRELATLLPLVALMFWIGIAPGIFFDTIAEPVDYIVRQVDPTYFDKQPIVYPAAAITGRDAHINGRDARTPEHLAEAR